MKDACGEGEDYARNRRMSALLVRAYGFGLGVRAVLSRLWTTALFYPEDFPSLNRFDLDSWSGLVSPLYSLANPGALIEFSRVAAASLPPFRTDRHKRLYCARYPFASQIRICLKHYRCAELEAFSTKTVFRHFHARKSFFAALFLRRLGIATPDPIALLQRWRNGLPVECFLLTAELDCPDTFDVWMRQRLQSMTDHDGSLFFRRLGGFVAQLHCAGVYHGALWTSIVACDRPRKYQFHLLDLDSLKHIGWIAPWERRKQISRIIENLFQNGALQKDVKDFTFSYVEYLRDG